MHRTRLVAAAVIVSVAALVAAGAVVWHGHGPSRRPAAATVPAPEAPPLLDWQRPGGVSAPIPLAFVGARPARIVLAGRFDAPVDPVGLTADGAAQVPQDPAHVGWYAPLGRPDARGHDVYIGHVNYAGKAGAFARLAGVRPGQTVIVTADNGVRSRFVVTSVRTYRKDRAPLDALFTPTGPHQLVLISCGGRYDRVVGHYDSNVVVLAEPQ